VVNVDAAHEQQTKQRIDYQTHADGSVTATLTVSLPNGEIRRFAETLTPAELEGNEVSGIFSGLGHFLKKAGKAIGHVAKKLATSKVFMAAAAGLAAAVPFAGPALAPALLAASGAIGVGGKLLHASVAAAHGAHDLAKKLTHSAITDAHVITKTPAQAQALLELANTKRMKAEAIASQSPAGAPPPRLATRPTPPRPSSTQQARRPEDVVAAAHAGRLRSNQGGDVTPAEVAAAHASGRVFWVV
jgi:hypothetical protein